MVVAGCGPGVAGRRRRLCPAGRVAIAMCRYGDLLRPNRIRRGFIAGSLVTAARDHVCASLHLATDYRTRFENVSDG